MNRFLYYTLLLCIVLTSCNKRSESKATRSLPKDSISTVSRAKADKTAKSRPALKLDSLGMVNLAEADSTFVVRLMYSRPDNFTGRVLYKELREAYLHPKAARGLLRSQRALRKAHPGYRLIIYDAARPMHIQREMWNVVKHTSKNIYVSNPAHGGGLHNYGLAVDISIVDANGKPLDMGTHVDYMGKAAHIDNESSLVHRGIISKQAEKNRQLLRQVMRKGGFRPLRTEWWHFNFCSRSTARKHYKVIK
jgi:D-alanyl-D-alanine dipeptidase